MAKALSENPECSVQVLGKHRPPNRFLDRLRKPLQGPGTLERKSFDGVDVVLSLVSTNLVPHVAGMARVPIVHCTDATPGFLRDFYGYDVPAERDDRERQAIESAQLVLYSSEFMMDRAIREFGETHRSKMAALPWGANIDVVPAIPLSRLPLEPVRLLFIGKDWERKGGDVAVATLKALQARGVQAELHLIGSGTEEAGHVDGVIAHGYLNKNQHADRAILEKVLAEAHLLVLPTRADCTPMVVAEANSQGIPVLIADTGGISSLMDPGRNGEMLPPGASGDDYADRVMALTRDAAQYERLSQSSYRHYAERLTWAAWSRAAVSQIQERFSTPVTTLA